MFERPNRPEQQGVPSERGQSDPLPEPMVEPQLTTERNAADPGDITQRAFRYQHAYGVVLIAAARRGTRDYLALWCEQHEDLLCERADAKFDGYQVKTSRPERGPWRMANPEMINVIARFADLVQAFGDKIGNLYFVSNTDCDAVTPASSDDRRRARCPSLFLEHIRSCSNYSEIQPPFLEAFNDLCGACGCPPDRMLEVLHRTHLIHGPSITEFDAALAHEHLGSLPETAGFTASQLDRLRDYLIGLVYRASSLQVTDPIRHLRPVIERGSLDPVLAAKRIVIADVVIQRDRPPSSFPVQFPGPSSISLTSRPPARVRQAKLEAGGLGDMQDYFADRELATEAHLMGETHKRPDYAVNLLRQLEVLVLGECAEAFLRHYHPSERFGREMLIEVQDRLRTLAISRPDMVGHQEYEILIGMVGLLTGDCRVWWSERFPITETAA
jgi:hypothetical protein